MGVTTANVELDQQTAFESAMRIFKREVNNSNIINEVKRRRYYEEAWMTRRRKEKERALKAKTFRRVITYDDKNPLADNSVFASEFGVIDTLLKPQRILHTGQKKIAMKTIHLQIVLVNLIIMIALKKLLTLL